MLSAHGTVEPEEAWSRKVTHTRSATVGHKRMTSRVPPRQMVRPKGPLQPQIADRRSPVCLALVSLTLCTSAPAIAEATPVSSSDGALLGNEDKSIAPARIASLGALGARTRRERQGHHTA